MHDQAFSQLLSIADTIFSATFNTFCNITRVFASCPAMVARTFYGLAEGPKHKQRTSQKFICGLIHHFICSYTYFCFSN